MPEELVPIFRVDDAAAGVAWYERLGFVVLGEHTFGPGMPRYVFLRRGRVYLHLSEHRGDAPAGSTAFLYVDDVDAVAAEFGTDVTEEPWGREVELTDPWDNRVRVGIVERAG